MALIAPFRGISYDPAKVGDLQKVVAPPYDVISPPQQDALYRRHPFNIIRLILNRETPEDTPVNNRYTRAAGHYRTWLKERILVRAPRPAFYFLEEEFEPSFVPFPGSHSSRPRIVRRGFVGVVHLEEFSAGVILPHEKTQNRPKEDRLALMEACRANFSQVFSLYEDEEGAMGPVYTEVFSSPKGPAFDITDDEGVRHKLWMVEDQQIQGKVTEILRPKKLFIADGHHRYETALAYGARERSRHPGGTGRKTYEFTMMYLTALEEAGLLILPTHRVVTDIQGWHASSFLDQVGADFSVQAYPFSPGDEEIVRRQFLADLASRTASGRVLGMLLGGQEQYFLLSLKEDQALDRAAPGLPPSLKALDVNLLHILIFQKILQIGPLELAAGKNVLYFKESQEAIRAVHSGQGQMAFFLNPTRVYQVRDVSLAGETMPSKSTFFYPKLLSGLVLNPLEPDEEITLE